MGYDLPSSLIDPAQQIPNQASLPGEWGDQGVWTKVLEGRCESSGSATYKSTLHFLGGSVSSAQEVSSAN